MAAGQNCGAIIVVLDSSIVRQHNHPPCCLSLGRSRTLRNRPPYAASSQFCRGLLPAQFGFGMERRHQVSVLVPQSDKCSVLVGGKVAAGLQDRCGWLIRQDEIQK
jgi:hypothetical protein